MKGQPITKRYDFLGASQLDVGLAAGCGPFVQAKTGTPGAIVHAAGALKLPIAATEEVEVNCAYFGDDLCFDIDDIKSVRIVAKITAIGANDVVEAIFGLASARNDDPDAIAQGIFWKVKASNVVVLESDDGTNNNDDVATGQTLSTTYREFVLDFSSGVLPRSPLEGGSVGGKGHVLASMSNASGKLIPVCRSTVFDLSNYAGGLQLIAQIYKSSADDTGTLYIKSIEIDLKDNLN
jgi:hypothetical protein